MPPSSHATRSASSSAYRNTTRCADSTNIFDQQFRAELEPAINSVYTYALAHHPDAAERYEKYANYEDSVFNTFDTKVKAGARAQLSQILSPFNQPALHAAFCTRSLENLRMESLLDGAVLLLHLPLAVYGLGAKTVYTLVKLRFFNMMERRRLEREMAQRRLHERDTTTRAHQQREWNQTRHVVFLCDEYQEVVSVAKDALSDLNFWDKSRSAKTVGIISAQGFSSFRAAIGDHALTTALLQHFRQIIAFRTEDEETIKRIAYLLGQIEVERESPSENRSHARTLGRTTRTRSEGSHIDRRWQNTVNPQFFRQLGAGEAFALLLIGGVAYDDVISTKQLIIAQPEPIHA